MSAIAFAQLSLSGGAPSAGRAPANANDTANTTPTSVRPVIRQRAEIRCFLVMFCAPPPYDCASFAGE